MESQNDFEIIHLKYTPVMLETSREEIMMLRIYELKQISGTEEYFSTRRSVFV